MAHDFAKTRARRQPEQKRPAPPPQAGKGLLMTGLITGLVLGFFFSFMIYISGILPAVNTMTAEDIGSSEAALAAAQQKRNEELEQAATRLQLEFYKELPNYEVVVENPAQSPATTAGPTATSIAIASLQQSAAATDSAPATASIPIPTAATTEPQLPAGVVSTLEPVTSQVVAATFAPAQTITPGQPSYMIQAGAFQQETSAVVQSQRLTALGLEARVKKEALLGKTLFLVQAGPYGSREEAGQAERILRSNGIDSMRIGVSQ